MLKITTQRPGVLYFSGALTIHSVQDLLEELKAVLKDENAKNSLRLCLDDVTEIDTAGAQILLAFKQSLPEGAVRMSVSEAVGAHIRICGLEKYLL